MGRTRADEVAEQVHQHQVATARAEQIGAQIEHHQRRVREHEFGLAHHRQQIACLQTEREAVTREAQSAKDKAILHVGVGAFEYLSQPAAVSRPTSTPDTMKVGANTHSSHIPPGTHHNGQHDDLVSDILSDPLSGRSMNNLADLYGGPLSEPPRGSGFGPMKDFRIPVAKSLEEVDAIMRLLEEIAKILDVDPHHLGIGLTVGPSPLFSHTR